MKKYTFILLICLSLVFASSAQGGRSSSYTTFGALVQCVNEYQYTTSAVSTDEKQLCDHRLVIRHNAYNCSNSYTNHFRGYAENGVLCGIKWITPGGDYAIQGSGFCEDYKYYVDFRGNTKYNEYESLTSVWIEGWFDVNYI